MQDGGSIFDYTAVGNVASRAGMGSRDFSLVCFALAGPQLLSRTLL